MGGGAFNHQKSLRAKQAHCKPLARAGRYVFTSERDPLLALHHALGHVNWRVVAKHARQHKIPLTNIANAFCEACLRAKHKKAPRGKRSSPAKQRFLPQPYVQWSADVFGPVKPSKLNKIQYQLVFLDRGSNTIKSYPLEHVRNIPDKVAQWVHEIRDELADMNVDKMDVQVQQPLKLRTDSAQYFKSARMREILRREKVTITFSPPYTQSRNAFCERSIAVVANMAKALLKASGMSSKDYWPEAWAHAVKIRDLLPRNANPGSRSPYSMRTNKVSPDPSKLYHPFGQPCMVFVPEDQREGGKMHWDQSRPGRIVGHDAESDAAKIAVESKNIIKKLVRTSAQYRVDSQMPKGVFSTDTINLPHEEDKYYYNFTELDADQQQLVEIPPQEKKPVETGMTATDDETMAVDDMEMETESHPSSQNAAQASAAPANMVEGGETVDTTQEISDDVLVVEPYGPRGAKSRYSVVNKDHEIVKDSFGMVNAMMKGNMMAYSVRMAIERNPEYKEAIVASAKVEVQGLIDKCLEEFDRSELRKSDKIVTLISLYTIKYEAA
jgi:hypothetical protein